MRKSNDIIFYSLLALCLFTNCLFIGYYYTNKTGKYCWGKSWNIRKNKIMN